MFPERAHRFGNAMRSFTEGTGFELHHIVDNYPWGNLENGTVVDVCDILVLNFPSFNLIEKVTAH